jgi:hypothetical protein
MLSRLGGAAVTAVVLPLAPILQQFVVQSSNEKKEINNMATGYNTLITILICAEYDPDSDVLSALKFPEPTEAFKRVSELTTKDECVRALKNTRLMSLTQNIPVVIQPSDRARGAL